MQDLANGLQGCLFKKKINLVKGYHRIPVVGEDIPKTAIVTQFGLFEYLFTPFRLSNAAIRFTHDGPHSQQFGGGVCLYGDSRVGSPDRQTQLIHSEAFFSALATNGLAINLEKCVFAVPTS
jgi:hypothetical protein